MGEPTIERLARKGGTDIRIRRESTCRPCPRTPHATMVLTWRFSFRGGVQARLGDLGGYGLSRGEQARLGERRVDGGGDDGSPRCLGRVENSAGTRKEFCAGKVLTGYGFSLVGPCIFYGGEGGGGGQGA